MGNKELAVLIQNYLVLYLCNSERGIRATRHKSHSPSLLWGVSCNNQILLTVLLDWHF